MDLWPNRWLVFGYDLPYLFIAEWNQLKQFYPDFYWVIFSMARFIRFGVPLLLVAIPLLTEQHRTSVLRLVKRTWKSPTKGLTKLLAVPILVDMLFTACCYFLLKNEVHDPLRFQLHLARSFLLISVGHLLLLAGFNWNRVKKGALQFLFPNVAPHALAVFRILFFGYLTIIFIWGFGNDAHLIGTLEKQSLPGIGWLIEITPVNPTLYTIACIMGGLFSLLSAIGYRTRLFMILNTVCVFYVVATPNFFGKLWHHQIIIWITWILAVSPCADVWSLDAKLGRAKANDANSGYGFHLRMIWLHLGLIYFFAGFHKLWVAGFDWALADTVVNLITIEWFEHYDKIAWPRVDRFPTLIKVGALFTIMFELSYLFLLLKKRWRWLAIGGGLLMHNLLGHFMYITFFATLQVFYMVYVPWNWILEKLNILKEVEMPQVPRPRWLSAALSIPVLIFCMNLLYGVFRINSYPFSVYPTYTDVVPDTMTYFDYRVLDKGKEQLDFRVEGKRHHFRWENYSRLEYAIINEFQREGVLDTAAVRTMWRRWQLEVPPLAEVDSVDVFVKYRFLSPDSSRIPLEPLYLMTIKK